MPAIQAATMVLDRLSPAVRGRLGELAHDAEFAAGAEILREGIDTPFLGLVISGRVALRLRIPEMGDRLTIVTCEAGELVGWSAVVAPFRATVDAIATEPTTIEAFDAATLRARLETDCELAAALLPLVLESVSGRLTASWQQLLDMFGSRAPEPW
ncbi:MAG TPA: cyclic nucleotide-binding domain-containing protein [Candidatus Dormibacteraeota bacterium]|nr:cyclic nucleotide-binding domain-containing protein [Candidatus Dormibacteraeota bacterium]